MGKSSDVTLGFRYHVAYFHGLCAHPIDKFLEFRAAGKTAWSGALTDTGTITINKPGLFGGDKDQGGIVGDVDIQFGKNGQAPNAYMLSVFGSQVPNWQGFTTLVFKGGEFGAMNPYPQKPAYKVLATKAGWDDDTCWYPEKCEVPLAGNTNVITITDFSAGFETNAPASFQLLGSAIANTTVNAANTDYYRLPIGGTVNAFSCDFVITSIDSGDALFITLADATGNYIFSFEPIAEDRIDSLQRPYIAYTSNGPQPIYASRLQASTQYSFDAVFRTGANDVFTYTLRQNNIVLATGTAAMAQTPPAYLWFGRTSNNGTSAVVKYTRVSLTGSGTGMNPAHVLYEVRTAQDRGQEPTANMADANWRAGADWFYNQRFGLCQCAYDADAESVDEFIARISQLASCSVSRDPVDGLWYLDIANGVYDLNALPILTDDDILEFEDTPTLLDDAVNSVAVEYYDPQLWTTVTTRPVTSLALIEANGLNHVTNQYHEIPTGGLANRLAQRDLMGGSTPSHGFAITTTRKPYAWRRNTYFRLQSPKNGIADMVCLLAEKSDGTLKSGAMKITAALDIFGLAIVSYMDTEPGVDTRPSQIPLAIVNQFAFEAPYFALVRRLSRADLSVLPADVGYLMTVAADPATSRDYDISVSTDDGATYVDGRGSGPWCPMAEIVEGDTLQDHAPTTSFTLANAALLSSVQVGAAALWDGEIVRVDAIDAGALTLMLGRGCADTPPLPHAANARIWFFDGFTGTDSTEYTDGETVGIKLLTNTFSDQLDPDVSVPMSVIFDQRQNRPYAPALLTVNGDSYPGAAISPLAVAWVHRDRIQQADQLIDTSQASIGPETGVTYTVRSYLEGTLAETLTDIDGTSATPNPGGFGTVRIEIDAVRDGIASVTPLTATFDFRSSLTISTASPIKIPGGSDGTFQLTASGGLPPLSWSVDAGTPLPAGITMDSTGLLTYDDTTVAGDTAVLFDVEDSADGAASATLTVSVLASFVDLVDSLSPVAHWRMDETSGTTLTDRVGAAVATLAGTGGTSYLLNQASLLKDDADPSVRFVTGYATTAADSKWALGTGDYSFFVIAKWTSTGLAVILNCRDGTAPNVLAQIMVNRATTGDVGIEGSNFSTSGASYRTTGTTYNDGKPHGIGLAFDSATGIMRLTIDGVYKGSNTVAIPRPTVATMRCNIANNFASQTFQGTVDEVVLFDHKLTDADMAALASHVAAS